MKYDFYIVIFFLSLYSNGYAQEGINTSLTLDSIQKESQTVFDYFQKNRYAETIVEGQKVLAYVEQNNNNNLKLKSKMYSLIGNSFFYGKNYELSLDYLLKAKDINIQLEDTSKIITSYNDVAISYRELDSVNKSKFYFKEALELGREYSDKSPLISFLRNIGNSLLSEGEYEEALEYIEEAKIIIDQNLEKKPIKVDIYQDFFHVYFKLEDYNKSETYFNEGIYYAKENKFYEAILSLYLYKAKLYASADKHDVAYETLNRHRVIEDSINTVEKFKILKEIEAKNLLIENREKLNLAQKDKEFQDTIIKKARSYNILLVIFCVLMLLSIYYILKNNKELNQAKEKAEQLSRAKSNFYSEISHELRTPLYAVIELSNLLLKENVNSKHKEYLESLNFSGNHLMSLINNVLELNKVESGRMKLETMDFKPRNLISNIIESLEFALSDSHNRIHLNYDNDIPNMLSGDSLKLSQVFINLISNAIKFTRDGNIYITIRLVTRIQDKVKLFFEVRDDGLGISKEKQIKVFEAFYQEHSKNDNSYKGTGLGLSIVKRILNVMESTIAIESEVDKGTAFSFDLMFSVSENGLDTEVEYSNLVEEILDKHILIVDDNRINQLVTKKVLSEFNIKSIAVNSGKKAIEMLRKETFDCVLMDLHMPELDGYETTNLIRKFNTNIAIIALTAASTEEVESKMNNCDMNGYIRKPFRTSHFIETIHRALV